MITRINILEDINAELRVDLAESEDLAHNRMTMVIQLRDEIDRKNIAIYGLVVFSLLVCCLWFVVS